MKKLRAQIDRLITGLQDDSRPASSRGGKPDSPIRRYRLSIIFFPLDLPER
jgi:hypothetical protein